MIIEIQCTGNVVHLNHLKTIPPTTITTLSWTVEKLSSMKPIPGAKHVGDCCFRISVLSFEHLPADCTPPREHPQHPHTSPTLPFSVDAALHRCSSRLTSGPRPSLRLQGGPHNPVQHSPYATEKPRAPTTPGQRHPVLRSCIS